MCWRRVEDFSWPCCVGRIEAGGVACVMRAFGESEPGGWEVVGRTRMINRDAHTDSGSSPSASAQVSAKRHSRVDGLHRRGAGLVNRALDLMTISHLQEPASSRINRCLD